MTAPDPESAANLARLEERVKSMMRSMDELRTTITELRADLEKNKSFMWRLAVVIAGLSASASLIEKILK